MRTLIMYAPTDTYRVLENGQVIGEFTSMQEAQVFMDAGNVPPPAPEPAPEPPADPDLPAKRSHHKKR